MNFCSGMCDAAIIEESGLPEPVRSAEELEARRHLCERAIMSLSARGSEVACLALGGQLEDVAQTACPCTPISPGLGAAHAVCMRPATCYMPEPLNIVVTLCMTCEFEEW
jgi:hypothetical protein